ncbi:penicillin-binding protein 2 [Rhodospirillales bacterium]|nr:penicillin-binding protein 2 [Rhodospirillales bacterium]
MTTQLPPVHEKRKLEGFGKEALETGRNRLLVAAAVLTLAFGGIGARLIDLSVIAGADDVQAARPATSKQPVSDRADIVDRNGVILASSLPTASLYADPSEVIDPRGAARKISEAFPEIDRATLTKNLLKGGRFLWVKRNLSPDQQMMANRLGIPGFAFLREERRVYPHGKLTAHILGATDIDGNGVAGIEKFFDEKLHSPDDELRLSLDIRVQSILRTELTAAVSEFKAIGAAGVVLDVHSGEVVAMVSLPDYDPNEINHASMDARFNRVTKGVYEMGSTFKLFTAAMALDSGTVDMKGGYDATDPIRIARFTINDFHAKKRWLSVPEIIVHSSNIGAAKMAVDVGTEGQQRYLKQLGLLSPSTLELPELGRPLTPYRWREINTMTISYGHGIAVTPVHLASAISTLVNGGMMYPTTLLKQDSKSQHRGERVISQETSDKMRQLMRLVVAHGTGRKAEAKGYVVGGKTGTAEKQIGGKYKKSAKISSFVGAFPIHAPRYVVFAMVDEPVGNKSTFNYATGGWVAAPVVKRVVAQIGPLLGIMPHNSDVEPLDLPVIDKDKKKMKSDPKLVKRASVSSGVVREKTKSTTTEIKPAPTGRSAPKLKTQAEPPPKEDPDDRIARKTREALEQAFAVR